MNRGAAVGSVAWRGALLAVTRLALFWMGIDIVEQFADGRQVFGYVLLNLGGFVEIGIVSAFTRRYALSLILSSCLIIVTSAALGWWWARRAARASSS